MTTRALWAKKGPVYITIGPQCSGKTTFLSQLQQRVSKDPNQRVYDVTIDDQEGVYLSVDVTHFLNPGGSSRVLLRRYIGKTIGARIDEQQELCIVLQRLAGRLTQTEFETAIAELYRSHAIQAMTQQDADLIVTEEMLRADYHAVVAEDLIRAVQGFVGQPLPRTVDLFCAEALFRPHPKTNATAVDAAARQLQSAARSASEAAVAWGNTNTRPREYRAALDAAAGSGRQVYFLPYGVDSSRVSNGVSLPKLEFQELLRRNIKRLLQTGKFVPAKGIFESSERVGGFMENVLRDLDRRVAMEDDGGGDEITLMHSKLDFDKRLAEMANYEMNDDRTVRFIPPPPPRKKRLNSPVPGVVTTPPPPPPASSSQLHMWRMSTPPQYPQRNPWNGSPRRGFSHRNADW